MILAGHGVIISRAYDELREFAEKAQIPVVTTLLGISGFPEDHVLSVGFPGMHGMAYASLAIDQADVLIAIGSRFDDRIVGDASRFSTGSRKVHIDIDRAEFNKSVRVEAPVLGDVRQVLGQLIPRVARTTHEDWVSHIEHLKAEHPSLRIPETDRLLGQHVVKGCRTLRKAMRQSSPASGSIRCGPPNTTNLPAPTVGSVQVAWARWVTKSRPPWARKSPGPTVSSGRYAGTAASR